MSTHTATLNNPRTINAWAFFDWANSAFALVITSAIFPAYFAAVTNDQVRIFGIEMSNSSLYAYAVSASYLVIAICSPILSGIADYGGRRMFFLKFFTIFGALGCLSLYLFRGMPSLAIGLTGFIVAMIGFAGGLVFYNSFLPQIVTEDRYDRVSARGFSFGYVGSVLLLLVNLWMILNSEKIGFANEGVATRLAFVMVGLWWIGFAQIPFRRLPRDPKDRPKQQLLTKGFKELAKVARIVAQSKDMTRFLGSFFCYSAGVQTAIFLAATFAEKELKFESTELIIIILILQLVAIGGAYFFAKVSDWAGQQILTHGHARHLDGDMFCSQSGLHQNAVLLPGRCGGIGRRRHTIAVALHLFQTHPGRHQRHYLVFQLLRCAGKNRHHHRYIRLRLHRTGHGQHAHERVVAGRFFRARHGYSGFGENPPYEGSLV